MGRSQETYGKKEVRKRKEKKRKDKEEKRAKKKTVGKKTDFNDMIAYVDEYGKISSTPPDPDKKIAVASEDIELKITRNSGETVSDFLRKGVVSTYNMSRRYGFIRDLESNQSIFFHANSLQEPIKENDIVIFEIGKGAKGTFAIKIKLFKG